ncbi:rho GTPase-activating protein REN1-like [Cynara cardunculus var. scolymus]|uniref:rho GTPase-activating protein REN1-like n=1 Tax=Cynara cardunculus var. scolymus TaxID=59895 RepID=UPI000D624837|nr:rho GTPase-activating protein REN1-like [Cynara cardunculus var. scolymus]
MMLNTKTHNADSKNNTGDTRNNHADSKHNNADSKMNIADSRNNHADLKNNPDSKTNADVPSHGDGGGDNMPPSSAAAQPLERQRSHNGSKVYKSGPLFLSSKGIGWTSWKKRWFILTETSLVFFRSDPNAAPQKGGESNLTLGGIDLNSSASVVVKADKKLLTVLFPVGRDGRAFTLKAETTEDLFEWKDALEAALANAPNAGTGPGQNGLLKNEKGDAADGSQEQSKDQPPAKSVVLGRPILLALEDIDGTPSFLEKALCYVEDYGVRVEGILRQAADVDDVERRIREYEQGKTEFTADEDGHVIGDCIKYVLRELPSPPVPASCCAALLEAYRSDRATRVSAIRAAICDTFPEPNRRLLQRILIMMEAVAENKAVNRMSVSAVAACMSPLLLRPLLAGEVDLGKGSDMGSDGSGQLLQAAAAANHAQAIVIILIEEYDKIFGEEDMLSDLYSDSDDYGSESEDLSAEYYEDDDYYEEDDDDDDADNGSCSYEDSEHRSSTGCSESGDSSRDHTKGFVSTNPFDDDRRHAIRRRSSSKKSSELANIEFVTEQQAEILRLEVTKIKLKEIIEAEARRNDILKEDLVSKKNALEARRVGLLQEVSKLEEELHKSQGTISDEKTNADPDDIIIDEAEADDPGLQQNCNYQPPTTTQDHGKVKDKDKDRESTTRSKDTKEDGDSKHDYFHSFSNKLTPSWHSDSDRNERSMSKSTSSRKSHSKGEAANTSSALSKITNRLNFLKEKRNQMTDELQSADKTTHNNHRGSRKWSDDESDKGKETCVQQRELASGRSEDQGR